MSAITVPDMRQDTFVGFSAKRILGINLAVTGIVLILMMLLGVTMRLAQSGWVTLSPKVFYQFLTLHGTGMVGIAALGGISVMWYFLSRYVSLNVGILTANLVLFLVGVSMILAADLVGGFGGAWTILYPLPAHSGNIWGTGAAFWHLLGLLLVGIGLLLICLDFGRALIAKYGGLGRSLGWPQLFRASKEPMPPPTVVASTMVAIVTTLCLIGGGAIIILSIVNLLVPQFALDPLFAKNVIYFFGHTIINATIYMAVVVVYELLPYYTGRPYKSSRPFLAAWTGSTIMVLIIFPHHLLMDFVMPTWSMAAAQVLSYTNSFPVMLATGFGALALVHRSGMKWDVVSGLLVLSMFGWMAGVVPAVIDATIVVNSVMHNTLWVPGHFHFYLMLGVIPMILAFMYYASRDSIAMTARKANDGWVLIVYLVAALGFVLMFLYSGSQSVPRRWAAHLPEWMVYDQIASVFAITVVLAAAFFIWRFLTGLRRFMAE